MQRLLIVCKKGNWSEAMTTPKNSKNREVSCHRGGFKWWMKQGLDNYLTYVCFKLIGV